MNEGILTRSRFHNKTLANQAIFLFSISTTFITPPNYYMWLHVIAFLVKSVTKLLILIWSVSKHVDLHHYEFQVLEVPHNANTILLQVLHQNH